MTEVGTQRKLHFQAEDNMRRVSSTPIKSDQSESPPSSGGSYEKLLEITETSGDFKGLILNIEDLSEDVYELKQNFIEQNIQLEKYLASIDGKLSLRSRAGCEEEGVESCDSFVYKKRKSKQNSAVGHDDDSSAMESDSDEDYPDVMNISRSLNSIMGNVGQKDVSLMQEVDTIEDKLDKFQTYLQEQKTEISRLELMKEALLMQNERMLKNQRRLEEEQSVTVKIIESKDLEIEMLRCQLSDLGQAEAGLGSIYAGLGFLRNNWTSLLRDLVRQPQQQTSWTIGIISLPTRILTSVLSNIL